jgi:hypothetical protein
LASEVPLPYLDAIRCEGEGHWITPGKERMSGIKPAGSLIESRDIRI